MAKRNSRRGKGEGSIFQRKDGTWEGYLTIGYDENGKQKRRYASGKTRAEVRDKLDEIKRQLFAGTFSDTQLTVKQYLQQWLDIKKIDVKPRSHEFYKTYIRLYIESRIGRVQLAKLTPLHVQSMMTEIAGTTSKDAANKARTVLTAALKQAVSLGLIPRNPVDAVPKFKHEPKEITLWTPQQVRTFLKTAEPHRLYAAFYLALATGMRHGEVLGLRWQDVEGDIITVRQSVITVRGAQPTISTPKTKKGIRRIAIGADGVAVLAAHKARQEEERRYLGASWHESGLVFTNEYGDLLIPRNFDRIWYDLQGRADVPRVRFHDLRHFHASLLIDSGLDPRTVADRIGHANPVYHPQYLQSYVRRAATCGGNQSRRYAWG